MFIFLDTETTGTGEADRLCQLAYKTGDGAIEVNELFNPERKIEIEAMCIHHITNEMVADKPLFKGSSTENELKKLLSDPDNYLVAHNASFDVDMLNREGISPKNVICTLKMARYLDKDGYYKKHNLQFLRYSMGLQIKADAHDAFGDILVLELVFQRIYEALLKLNENSQQKTIQKMLEISSKPSLLSRMHFGKHKGELFANIPKDYLSWLAGKGDLDEDVEFTVNYYLKQT